MATSDYRRRRVIAFLDPWADPLGDGFQMIQSMIAVGTGGVFGRGLMDGVQKLFYLPEPHNDFIYAVIAEELGLIGATVVLACFCVITLARPAHRDARARSLRRVPRLGLTTMVAFQAFFNISVVLGTAADQGHSAAVRQRRRLVAADQPDRHGDAAERVAARVLVARRHDGAAVPDA